MDKKAQLGSPNQEEMDEYLSLLEAVSNHGTSHSKNKFPPTTSTATTTLTPKLPLRQSLTFGSLLDSSFDSSTASSARSSQQISSSIPATTTVKKFSAVPIITTKNQLPLPQQFNKQTTMEPQEMEMNTHSVSPVATNSSISNPISINHSIIEKESTTIVSSQSTLQKEEEVKSVIPNGKVVENDSKTITLERNFSNVVPTPLPLEMNSKSNHFAAKGYSVTTPSVRTKMNASDFYKKRTEFLKKPEKTNAKQSEKQETDKRKKEVSVPRKLYENLEEQQQQQQQQQQTVLETKSLTQSDQYDQPPAPILPSSQIVSSNHRTVSPSHSIATPPSVLKKKIISPPSAVISKVEQGNEIPIVPVEEKPILKKEIKKVKIETSIPQVEVEPNKSLPPSEPTVISTPISKKIVKKKEKSSSILASPPKPNTNAPIPSSLHSIHSEQVMQHNEKLNQSIRETQKQSEQMLQQYQQDLKNLVKTASDQFTYASQHYGKLMKEATHFSSSQVQTLIQEAVSKIGFNIQNFYSQFSEMQRIATESIKAMDKYSHMDIHIQQAMDSNLQRVKQLSDKIFEIEHRTREEMTKCKQTLQHSKMDQLVKKIFVEDYKIDMTQFTSLQKPPQWNNEEETEENQQNSIQNWISQQQQQNSFTSDMRQSKEELLLLQREKNELWNKLSKPKFESNLQNKEKKKLTRESLLFDTTKSSLKQFTLEEMKRSYPIFVQQVLHHSLMCKLNPSIVSPPIQQQQEIQTENRQMHTIAIQMEKEEEPKIDQLVQTIPRETQEMEVQMEAESKEEEIKTVDQSICTENTVEEQIPKLDHTPVIPQLSLSKEMILIDMEPTIASTTETKQVNSKEVLKTFIESKMKKMQMRNSQQQQQSNTSTPRQQLVNPLQEQISFLEQQLQQKQIQKEQETQLEQSIVPIIVPPKQIIAKQQVVEETTQVSPPSSKAEVTVSFSKEYLEFCTLHSINPHNEDVKKLYENGLLSSASTKQKVNAPKQIETNEDNFEELIHKTDKLLYDAQTSMSSMEFVDTKHEEEKQMNPIAQHLEVTNLNLKHLLDYAQKGVELFSNYTILQQQNTNHVMFEQLPQQQPQPIVIPPPIANITIHPILEKTKEEASNLNNRVTHSATIQTEEEIIEKQIQSIQTMEWETKHQTIQTNFIQNNSIPTQTSIEEKNPVQVASIELQTPSIVIKHVGIESQTSLPSSSNDSEELLQQTTQNKQPVFMKPTQREVEEEEYLMPRRKLPSPHLSITSNTSSSITTLSTNNMLSSNSISSSQWSSSTIQQPSTNQQSLTRLLEESAAEKRLRNQVEVFTKVKLPVKRESLLSPSESDILEVSSSSEILPSQILLDEEELSEEEEEDYSLSSRELMPSEEEEEILDVYSSLDNDASTSNVLSKLLQSSLYVVSSTSSSIE